MNNFNKIYEKLNIAINQNNWGEARNIAGNILKKSDNKIKTSYDISIIFLEKENYVLAANFVDIALNFLKSDPVLYSLKAKILSLSGDHKTSTRLYERAYALDSSNWEYELLAGIELTKTNQLDLAKKKFEELLLKTKKTTVLLYNLGIVYRDIGDMRSAENFFLEAWEMNNTDPEISNAIGSLYHSQFKFNEALKFYEKTLELSPNYEFGIINIASLLIDMGESNRSLQFCAKLKKLNPDNLFSYLFSGSAYALLGDIQNSYEEFLEGFHLNPDDIRFKRYLSLSAAKYGKYIEARKQINILQKNSESDISSPIYLGSGDLRQGWKEYKNRESYFSASMKYGYLSQSIKLNLQNKILIIREQGIGDELFFYRYIPMVSIYGASITILTSKKIESIVKRMFPDLKIITNIDERVKDVFEQKILCGDLPLLLEKETTNDTTQISIKNLSLKNYLHHPSIIYPKPPPSIKLLPLANKIQSIKKELNIDKYEKPYIALSWRAGTPVNKQASSWQLFKEIPLKSLLEYLPKKGTYFVVQREPAYDELNTIKSKLGPRVLDLSRFNDDLEGMLAVLSLADFYVCVSNTNTHLRAMVSDSCEVLSPNTADWRWMYKGKSPWFPNFNIYRQELNGGWEKGFQKLHMELIQYFEK